MVEGKRPEEQPIEYAENGGVPATPSASIPITIRLNPGLVRIDRHAIFTSCPHPAITPPMVLLVPSAAAGGRALRIRRTVDPLAPVQLRDRGGARGVLVQSGAEQLGVAPLQVVRQFLGDLVFDRALELALRQPPPTICRQSRIFDCRDPPHGLHKGLPSRTLRRQNLAAGGRELVEAAPPRAVALHPDTCDPTPRLQPVQQRVKRRHLNFSVPPDRVSISLRSRSRGARGGPPAIGSAARRCLFLVRGRSVA